MDKSAIRNFAIEARKMLMKSAETEAGFYGVTKNGCKRYRTRDSTPIIANTLTRGISIKIITDNEMPIPRQANRSYISENSQYLDFPQKAIRNCSNSNKCKIITTLIANTIPPPIIIFSLYLSKTSNLWLINVPSKNIGKK